MPFFQSRQRDLYFERHGRGPAVLFLHGAGSNGATWWQQLPAFSPHYTCLTLDLRCFGRSAAPTDEFRFECFVDDVIALLDCEEIDRVALVGQSLGGMIGLRLALQQPKRVWALAACDSSLAVDHPGLIDSVRRRFESVPAVGIEQRSLGRWFNERHPALAALYAQINHFNPSALRIPAEEWRHTMLRLNEPAELIPQEALRGLACPTLLLVGADDPIVPTASMHELAALMPRSKVVVVDNAAHSAYFEQATVFNEELLAFLGDCRIASNETSGR